LGLRMSCAAATATQKVMISAARLQTRNIALRGNGWPTEEKVLSVSPP
jgi:hypothetical protein